MKVPWPIRRLAYSAFFALLLGVPPFHVRKREVNQATVNYVKNPTAANESLLREQEQLARQERRRMHLTRSLVWFAILGGGSLLYGFLRKPHPVVGKPRAEV
jgi:hypothetical protein